MAGSCSRLALSRCGQGAETFCCPVIGELLERESFLKLSDGRLAMGGIHQWNWLSDTRKEGLNRDMGFLAHYE